MAIGGEVTAADFEPLDMEELKQLPDEFKDKYMLLERLYGDKAWALVKAWASQSADQQVTSILNAPNWEQTVYARGKRDAFIEMIHMERGTNFQFRNIIHEAVVKAAQADEDRQAQEEQDNE